MSGTAQLSVSLATGEFPCPRDGMTLTLLVSGAWCPQCHTVWRESGEIVVPPPLADEIDRLRARVAELDQALRGLRSVGKCPTCAVYHAEGDGMRLYLCPEHAVDCGWAFGVPMPPTPGSAGAELIRRGAGEQG